MSDFFLSLSCPVRFPVGFVSQLSIFSSNIKWLGAKRKKKQSDVLTDQLLQTRSVKHGTIRLTTHCRESVWSCKCIVKEDSFVFPFRFFKTLTNPAPAMDIKSQDSVVFLTLDKLILFHTKLSQTLDCTTNIGLAQQTKLQFFLESLMKKLDKLVLFKTANNFTLTNMRQS